MDQLGIPDLLGAGGAHLAPDGATGSPSLRDILRTLAAGRAPVQASRAALAALDSKSRTDGMLGFVAGDGSSWQFVAASTASDPTQNLVLTPANQPPEGRWLRVPFGGIDLAMPFLFSTADQAPLLTLPVNALLLVRRGYWKVTTPFTGAGNLGLASTNAGFNTAGDLLGGASGDGDAVLGTVGVKVGTAGTKTDAGVLLVGGDAVTVNVLAAFGAGAGEAHIVGDLLANPGV